MLLIILTNETTNFATIKAGGENSDRGLMLLTVDNIEHHED